MNNIQENISLSNQLIEIDQKTILICDILNYVDIIVRIISFIAHLFYFFMIIKIEKLREISMLFAHHANFIGFLFNLHYCLYLDSIMPSFDNEKLNNILCLISEQAWAFLKISRSYAIVLIAIYRLIATFKLNLHKRINNIKILLSTIFSMYAIIIIFIAVNRFGFGTTYGNVYCFDGYSPVLLISALYFFNQSVFGLALPTVIVLVSYYLIKKKLQNIKNSLQNTPFPSGNIIFHFVYILIHFLYS